MSKPAARQTDLNACPIPIHGPNPTVVGSPDVLINGLPALRMGDASACGDVVAVGMPNILVNGQPIAFLGSATAHGGVIVTGSGDVVVGTEFTPATFVPPAPMPGIYEDRFQLVCQSTGEPLAGFAYVIRRAGGSIERGTTDNHGFTHLVSGCAVAERVVIYAEDRL